MVRAEESLRRRTSVQAVPGRRQDVPPGWCRENKGRERVTRIALSLRASVDSRNRSRGYDRTGIKRGSWEGSIRAHTGDV